VASGFVGRSRELALLTKRLDRVAADGSGVALAIRGRRQVGKSRLVQEFCDRSGAPYFYFTATKGASPVEAVAAFTRELRESALPPEPALVPDLATGSWPDALRVLAAALPDRPSIVVLDELPWLAEQDSLFDGALQTAWDRLLSTRAVLLLLLGSDLHMMARLTAYDQPFYGRADNLVLGPLNPAETGDALGLTGADAIDAHLVSGGLPGILRAWPHATPALTFLEQECQDPASALFSVPGASLLAEFPQPDQARRVIEAVGAGERTHANIAATAGGREGAIPSGSLSPLLHRLTEEKHILEIDHPLSTQPGKPALYRIADPNLRIYLAALRQAEEQTRRGRSGAAFALIQRRWPSYRGKAVEPLIREALELAATAGQLPWTDVTAVGGWWNRRFDPEIDLVGTDRTPVAQHIHFTGSIKWLGTPFDRHDLAAHHTAAAQVPGYEHGRTGVVVATLSGTDLPAHQAPDVVWGPEEVLDAWR
jgi:AAA+ ATPase superfamily predicted ATPase